MKQSIIKQKTIKNRAISVAFILLITAWIFVSFLLFYSRTSTFTINSRTSQMNLDISYLSDAVDRRVESAVNYMNMLATLISSNDAAMGSDTVNAFVKSTLKTGSFDEIIIADSQGTGVDSKGEIIDMSEFVSFEKAISGKSGKSAIHTVGTIQLFTTFSPIIRNNMIVGAAFGIHSPSSFFENIKVNTADANKSFYIFENTGEIVYSSKSDSSSIDEQTNIFPYMSSLSYEKKSNFQDFEEILTRDENGTITYLVDDETIISNVSVADYSDWHLMINMPKKLAESAVRNITRYAIVLLVNAVSSFIILTLAMLWYNKHSHAVFVKTNHQLALSNEIFNLAMEHITSDIFEYNTTNGSITFITNKNSSFFVPKTVVEKGPTYDTVESIFGGETSTVQKVFDAIKRGEKSASCTIRMLKTDGSTAWGKISLSNVYDDNNKPIRAVGIIEDVTKNKEGEELYEKEEQYRSTILAETMLALEINLTRNIYIRIHPPASSNVEWVPYSSRSITFTSKIHHDDLNLFSVASSRKKLLRDYDEGNTKHYIKFRMRDETGEFIWVSSATHLLCDPATGDIKAFTYVRDIDAEERKAVELQSLADSDQLTGILNRASFENSFNEFLRKPCDENELHALLYIDLDNFKSINDTLGHVEGDKVLCNTASTLSSIMREDDLVARMGGDEFMVFITHFKGKRYIRGRTAEICAALSSIKVSDDMNVSASIGGVMIPIDGMSFQTLYKKADGALYLSKRSGKNKFTFYNDEE